MVLAAVVLSVVLVVLFFSQFFGDGFLPIKNNYHAQNVEIWRRTVKCRDLISACDFDAMNYAQRKKLPLF